MRAQSEALRLADALEADQQGIDLGAEGMGWGPSTATRTQAAAELRRLYAEVDRLSYQLAYPDNFVKEPEQEPVAWIEHHKGGDNLVWDDPGGKRSALYTSPPARKPLTDEEIKKAFYDFDDGRSQGYIIAFARAIEEAHGIYKEEN